MSSCFRHYLADGNQPPGSIGHFHLKRAPPGPGSALKAAYRITWRFPDGREMTQDGYPALNLLAHGEISGVVIPQACGGQAECGTCRVRIPSGEVTAPTPDEEQLRRDHRKSFAPEERLSCRARPRSDLVVLLRGEPPADLREGAQ